MSEWISVKDRLPEVGEQVIVYRQKKDHKSKKEICFDSIAILCHDNLVWWNSHFLGYEVTHWMPLPEPPKGAKDE